MIRRISLIRNYMVRSLMKSMLPIASYWYETKMARRLSYFTRQQQRLRIRYGITNATPICDYNSETRKRVQSFALYGKNVHLVSTSGTTGKPKKIAYTQQRLRRYKTDARACAVQCFYRFGVQQPTIFILSSLKLDDSFASYVLLESKVDYFTGLIEPARYMRHPMMLDRVQCYGVTAVRFWLLLLSQPGILYATNPSTVAMFLTQIYQRWDESTAMIRAFCQQPKLFFDLEQMIRSTGAEGYLQRMQVIAEAQQPMSIEHCFPGLFAWSSWDGGYVGPYVQQVKKYFPPNKFPHIPMFSMSTEVVQTLTFFDVTGKIHFLPVAQDVFYEFLAENAPEEPEHLITADTLQPGLVYAMVVSDCYGLIRYHTRDLFECCGLFRGLPDLRFVRRAGLSYSFTGEKLTGEQIIQTFTKLREQQACLDDANIQLCCFPSRGTINELPCYQLVLVLAPGSGCQHSILEAEIGLTFERILSELNQEFSVKRTTGRLGETQVMVVTYEWIVARLDSRTRTEQDVLQRTWESQFKLSAFYTVLWEDILIRNELKTHSF